MRIIIILSFLFLNACTFVSKDLYKETRYRSDPKITEVQYSNLISLNIACNKQHPYPSFFLACAWVPLDPSENCIVRYVEGDEDSRKHEIQHCHGYKDTWIPIGLLEY